MVEDSEIVEALSLNKIISNREQKLSFSEEYIKQKASIIKENGQVEPIIVRPLRDKNGTFEICEGQDIYDALKYLKRPTAQVIKKDYSVNQGCEIALASLFRYIKLTSIEREDHVYARYINGKYKTYRELSKIIPLSPERIGELFYVKEQRIKITGTNGPLVSTDAIIACKKLSISDQRKFCKLIEKGEISGRAVHKEAKYIASRTPDERKALLSGKYSYKDVKYVIEKRFPLTTQLLDKIKRKLKETIVIEKAVKEERVVYSAEIIRDITNLIKSLDPTYIDKIEDEIERKQAIFDVNILIAIGSLLSYNVNGMSHDLFTSIHKGLGFSLEDIKNLKEDGHSLFFESEYQTPKEEELIEKSRKLDTTRGGLLEVLA